MKKCVKITSYGILLLLGLTIFAGCWNDNESSSNNSSTSDTSTNNSSTNHEHSYTKVVTEPTCEKDGYTTYTCQCGDSYTDEIVTSLGHDWDNGTVLKAASCMEEGTMHYTCLNDSTHTKDEPISKTSHNLTKHDKTDSTCVTKGNIEYYSCSVCEKYFADAEGKNIIEDKESVLKDLSTSHEFSNWKIDSAEFGKEGKLVRECNVDGCDEKEYLTNNISNVYIHSIKNDTELSNLFTVTKGSTYTFNFENGVMVNTNQLQTSSEATITLKALYTGTITFDVAIWSESNFDYLTILKGNNTVYNSKVSDKNKEEIKTTISIEVVKDDEITINKKADGSGWGKNNDDSVDYAKLSNIKFAASEAPENVGFIILSFDSVNGTSVNPLVAMKNQPVNDLVVPKRNGFIFENWYVDENYLTLFDATIGCDKNTTLYAKWISEDETCLARGTYLGYEVYGLKSTSTYKVYSINVDCYGRITTTSSDSEKFVGTISNYDETTQKYTWTNGTKTGTFFYNDALGVIIVEENFNDTMGSDFYVLMKNASADVQIKMSAFEVNSNNYDSQLIEIKSGDVTTLFAVYNNKMYSNVSISSVLTDVSTITIDNVSKVTDICVKDANGQVLFTQGYDSTSKEMVNVDDAYGIYTNEDGTLKIGGVGTLKLNDNEASYTILENGVVESIINNVCYHFTLSENTYSVTVPTVTIDFVTGQEHNDVSSQDYNINIVASLPVLEENGYVFNGWFFDEEFTEAVPSSWKPTENDTLYAKFSSPAKLTVVYNNGSENSENTYSVGETVTVDNPVYVKHAFVGWYTTSTFTSGSEWTSGSTINENTTIYAKWVDALMYGTTYGIVSISGTNTNGNTASTSYNNDFTVDVDGSTDNAASWPFNYNCSITDYSYENGTFTVLRGSTAYRAYVDVDTGLAIVNRNSGLTASFTNDVYLLSPFESNATGDKVDFKDRVKSSYWNSGKTRTIEYTTSGGSKYTIFVYNDEVYFNVSFLDATTNASNVAANNCYKAESLYVYSEDDTLIASFGYNGTTMVALDGKEGTYTSIADTVVLNGIDKITLNGSTGVYTLVDDKDYTLTAVVNNVYYEITLNGSSCNVVKPMVTLTFDANGGTVTESSISVNKNIEVTLQTPIREGFVFKGWEVASLNVSTTYTPVEDVTLKAVWNELFTVTLVNNNETENVVLSVENNNDVTAHKDYNEPIKSEFIFNGWYLDEDLNTPYDGAITSSVTLYAKWMTKPGFVGEYKGVEVWGSSNKGSLTAGKTLKIDEKFVMSGSKSGQIDATSYDSKTGIMKYGSSNYLMMYTKQNDYEFILINYSSSTTDVIYKNDFYVFVKSETNCSGSNANQYIWNDGSERIFALTIGDETIIIYINANDNTFYGGVELFDLSDNAISCTNEVLTATTSLVIKDNTGKVLREFAKDGSSFVKLDGYQGVEYTGELGTITFDGANKAVVAGTTCSYVIESNGNINLTYNNMTKILAVDKTTSSYTTLTDGSEGTYTNDVNSFVSNGDGTCTYNTTSGTYIISGNNVTYYIGEEKTSITLQDDGTYLTKSIFAGYTFTGNYMDGWNDSNSLKIVFDDSSSISGVLYAQYGTSYYFNFTATFDGTTLVMTVTNAVSSSYVGDTITATLSGNTLTITNTTISNFAYTFANQGSATCADFNG